jgi:DNA mismatch repair protein MSH6
MVSRDLTQVFSPSTRLDGNMRTEAVHLLALCEEPLHGSKDSSSNQASVAVGFAFVDAAAGRFYVGSIQDDCSHSGLRELLTKVAPQEILYELGALSDDMMKVLRNHHNPGLLPVVLSALTHEYMEPQMVNKMVKDHGYFKTVSGGGGSGGCPLQAFESLSNKNLAASALGALISHLVRLKVRSMSIVRCSSLV